MQKAFSNCSKGMRMSRNLAVVFVVAAAALTCACGGGSANVTSPSASTPTPGVTLQKIKITPASSIIQLAQSRQLFAQGTYSDGTTQDLSSSVTWSATSLNSSSNFVSVSKSGVATATAIGATTITATLGSVEGVLTLTVGANGFSSSTMAILTVPKGTSVIDVAYLPQQTQINGSYAVQEVNLDADQFTSLLPVPVALISSIGMPAGYIPNAAAGSQSSNLIAVISYSSPDVQVIDASNESSDVANNTIIGTFHSPVTSSVTINGTACGICAAVVNPLNDELILSTAQGFYSMNMTTGVFTQMPFTPAPEPSANISIDPVTTQDPFIGPDPFILSTVPSTGEIQILDLTKNTVATYAVGGTPTDAVIDLQTQYSTVVDGSTSDETLIDFTGFSYGQAPQTVTGVATCTSQPDMNMAALGVPPNPTGTNPTYYLLTGQTGGSCVGFQILVPPATLAPPNVSYGYGSMPLSPDGVAFVSNSDPNAIATFTSVVQSGNPTFGLLLDGNQQWVAKINFATVASNGQIGSNASNPVPLPAGLLFPSTVLTVAGQSFPYAIVYLPTPSTQLTVSQDILNFSTTNVGTSSPQFTVTVNNISSEAILTPQITLGGATSSQQSQGCTSAAGDFAVVNSCTVALQPETNCTVGITFTPTAAGSRCATVGITANGQPTTQTVLLSGTGQ